MYEDEPESTRRLRNKESIIHRSSHEYRGHIVRQAPFFENRVINIIIIHLIYIYIHLKIYQQYLNVVFVVNFIKI